MSCDAILEKLLSTLSAWLGKKSENEREKIPSKVSKKVCTNFSNIKNIVFYLLFLFSRVDLCLCVQEFHSSAHPLPPTVCTANIAAKSPREKIAILTRLTRIITHKSLIFLPSTKPRNHSQNWLTLDDALWRAHCNVHFVRHAARRLKNGLRIRKKISCPLYDLIVKTNSEGDERKCLYRSMKKSYNITTIRPTWWNATAQQRERAKT